MKAPHFYRLAALTAVAALPLALAAPASAATAITFDCQADAPVVGPQQVSLTQNADVTAPATVAPGGAFDVVIDPAPNTVPSDVGGNKVKNINTFALKFPVPANSTYVSADLMRRLRPRRHPADDQRRRRRRDPELPRPDHAAVRPSNCRPSPRTSRQATPARSRRNCPAPATATPA